MPAVRRGRSTLFCAAGLILAAAGIGLVWAARGQAPPAVAIRIGALLGIATIVGLVRWRWVPALCLAVAAWAGAGFFGSGGPAALGLGLRRWLRRLAAIAGAAVRALVEARGMDAMTTAAEQPPGSVPAPVPAARRPAEPGRWPRRIRVALLLVLAPICAEYLAAYDASTGDAAALLGALLISRRSMACRRCSFATWRAGGARAGPGCSCWPRRRGCSKPA